MSLESKLQVALHSGVGAALIDTVSYIVFSCLTWAIFCVVFRTRFAERRISNRPITRKQIVREVLYSLRSVIIFGAVTGLVVYAEQAGATRTYRSISEYGWGWFISSIFVMIFLHDAYFYWSHRLMHLPRFYKKVHHAHHLSVSPTPWAAYAFSTKEALLQAGIGPLCAVIMPFHPVAFGIFMLWQIFFNVVGHCGYEFWPSWFIETKAGKFFNTVTHHHQHHEKFTANYGLYFNIWDRLMGTNHPEYEARFLGVTSPHADTLPFPGVAAEEEAARRAA